MTPEQLAGLQSEVVEDTGPLKIYRPAFSQIRGDRTLLYGYDCDRNTYHVYLKDDLVHLAVYKYGDATVSAITEFEQLRDLVPNKRLYPESCDYEFCKFLKEAGVYLSFTTHNSKRTPAQFYGRLAD